MLTDIITHLVQLLATHGNVQVVIKASDKSYQLGTMMNIAHNVSLKSVALKDGVLVDGNVECIVVG